MTQASNIREQIQAKIRERYSGLVAKYQEELCSCCSENPTRTGCCWQLLPVQADGSKCFYFSQASNQPLGTS